MMIQNMHENREYHKSITDELHILKDRIRNLVRYWDDDDSRASSNWQTDGEWKESALRSMLRRHLPSHVHVGRGFVLFKSDSSTQIDILILNPDKPTVFRDGELAIVTPDAPAAVIEVKTRIANNELTKTVEKLCQIGTKCRQGSGKVPWLGLFVYEGSEDSGDRLLEAACKAEHRTGTRINCISFGRDTFVRFWPKGEWETGDSDDEQRGEHWRAYRLQDVAPAYFIGNVVDVVCGVDNQRSDYAWFTHHDGKRSRKIGEKRVGECEADESRE